MNSVSFNSAHISTNTERPHVADNTIHSLLLSLGKSNYFQCNATAHYYNHVHLEDFLSILLCIDVSIVVSTCFDKHSQECFGNGSFVTHS